LDGRFWSSLNIGEKGSLVLGLRDGINHSVACLSPSLDRFEEEIKGYWPTGLTAEEIAFALERFYETPENRPIPIVKALFAIAARSSGTAEAQVQRMIEVLRADAVKSYVQRR
jgi:hypothetical protein